MALLGNIHLRNARSTEQFLTASFFRDGGVLIEVFPIRYDLSVVALGLPEVVKGIVHDEPRERLSEKEWIRRSSTTSKQE